MPLLRSFLALALVPLLSACASMTTGCRTGDQPCKAYGPPNGEIENGTSCAVLVQNRHFCKYDEVGRFKGDEIRADGVCVCLSLGAAAKQTEVACAPTQSALRSKL